MKRLNGLVFGIVLMTFAGVFGEIPDLLVSSYGGGATLLEDGRPVWNFGRGVKPCQDAWLLADGNFLIPTGDIVQIVTPENEVVWSYQGETPASLTTKPSDPEKARKWKPKRLEIHSCQPLPEGHVLITECGQGRFVEVNRAGRVVNVIRPEGERADNHGFNRVVRKTKQGTYVATLANDRVGEFDADGRPIRMIDSSTTETAGIKWGHVHGLAVLKNGNWLIGTGYGAMFFEITPENEVVWSLKPEDVPEIGLKYAAGCQRLKDGTTVLTSFSKSKYQVFAVNEAKEVVWKWKAPQDPKGLSGVTQVQVLDESGDPARFQLQK